MKIIPLSKGQVAVVDDDDYEWLSQYAWYCCTTKQGGKYARRHGRKTEAYRQNISMHRQIMNAPPGLDVDHRNMDTLDNRKENLRLCTRSQNKGNIRKRKQRGIQSSYKGVGWCTTTNRWRARITKDGRETTIGRFDTEEQAALAYDEKAKELFGSYARLNFC